jgi:DNA helicase MCM9
VEYADLEQRNNALVTPEACRLFEEGGARCKGTNLTPVGSVHTDYQEIKIQEAASRIGIGRMPRSLLIKLQHDLVDTCQPGDEVVLVGSLLAQWERSVMPEVDCNVGMALKAHSIRVLQEKGASAWKNHEEGASVGELEKLRQEFDAYWDDPTNKANPIAARDFICKAVCPKLYGMSMVKLGLLITLIGGVDADSYKDQEPSQSPDILDRTPPPAAFYADGSPQSDDHPDAFHVARVESTQQENAYSYDDNRNVPMQEKRNNESVHTRRRDQSHMLLVGDPGTGKSQFLRFAAALCPRSVLTTGVGTTSAGLTCAAVREGSGKEFVLEAGALVLADKGVCCIDEFGCIQYKDRTTIHEAMEQQTLSVAKAGIVCKLNCRATIIAVMNPRDCLYDNHTSLSRNTGLGTPLLSRFDIIFKLVDTSDASRDCNIATYLLNRAIQVRPQKAVIAS